MAMRGLTVFISDLRNCQNAEAEKKRVEKEMAHIRLKFTTESQMNGYQRKKYVWKILYMYMLGYEVDFGHMEAVNLISSPKYSEKSVGYAWCALMLREGDELLRLIINSIRLDLISKQENAICLVGAPPPSHPQPQLRRTRLTRPSPPARPLTRSATSEARSLPRLLPPTS